MSDPRFSERLPAFLSLGKPHITLPVSLSALTGFILFTSAFSRGYLSLFMGIFLLSSASAAINQLQEIRFDALMHRTRGRPLPAGSIRPVEAWSYVVVTGLAGLFLLWHAGGLAASGLGLLNLVLYNLVYTPWKRFSLFAVVPGALVGAIPPLIGWISAGGHPLHFHIMLLFLFFFIGQIPHTWLILLRYDREYKQAGFPSLSEKFSPGQNSMMTFVWVTATAMAAIIMALSGLYRYHITAAASILTALMLVIVFGRWLFVNHAGKGRAAFLALNISYLLVMLFLLADRLL